MANSAERIESRGRRLRRDRLVAAGASTGGGLIRPLGAAVTSLVVARNSGLEVLGGVVEVQIVVQLAALVAQWGGRQALVRAMATESGTGAVLWRAGVVARLWWLVTPTAVVVVVLVSGRMAVPAVIWFAALWFVEMVEGRVTVSGRFAAAGSVDLAVLVLAVAALVLLPPDPLVVVWVYSGAAAARSVLLWRMTRPERRERRTRIATVETGGLSRLAAGVDSRGWSRLVADSPLAGASLAGYGQSRGAVVLAAATLGPASLAVFSVLANLVQITRTAVGLVHRPHAPALHRLRTPSVLVFARSQMLVLAPPVTVGLAVMFAVVGRLYGFTPDALWLIPAVLAVAPLAWRMPVTLRLLGTDRAAAVWWSTVAVASVVMSTGGPILSRAGVTGGLWLLAGSELAMTGAALVVARGTTNREPAVPR